MEGTLTIQKNRKLPLAQDYEFLRKEGLKHIENLSHDLWTDYNTHDPGITILEALCYAITELGYRSGFDMKDLLATADGKMVSGQTFYTAKEILTVNPLTINDYRKLLVDIEGVQNAWLIAADFITSLDGIKTPVNEVPLFANCAKDELQTDPTDKPLFLSGLYQVLLSLDHEDEFGDLNNGDIILGNPELIDEYAENDFFFSIELPAWKKADFVFAELAKEEINIDSATITPKAGSWHCKLKLTAANAEADFGITISIQPASGKVKDTTVQAMFGNKKFLTKIFDAYFKKIIRARDIVKVAIKKLQEHRNLCEDFVSVTSIDDEQIAFCFDVDVRPEADIEKIQAEIFYAIENYLSPPIHFYTLREMRDKKIPVDEIFNGPRLDHGFIDAEQLAKTNLRPVIYASDIINLLMDIEGVRAIRNFLMTKYDAAGNTVPGYTALSWCMKITPLHKPALRADKSKILLFKNQLPFIAKYEEVRDTVLLLHAIHSGNKLNGIQDDLPVPVGRKRDTESHWPVQYDFPQTYGIGEAGLPAGATDERRSQQKQLKAYLMFYEQLLADFISQLSNAHSLFSTEEITHTYYAQFLGDIKGSDCIFKPTLAPAINTADSLATSKNGWQELYEPKYLFEDRRTRFLDHLLARFAESFNDYALLMYKINYEDRAEERMEPGEIISSKMLTLKNYPDISSNRGRAFNYFPQKDDFTPDDAQYWDTENVSGLEKRICFLTGIKDFSRRYLYCIKNIEVICTEKEVTENGNSVLKCFHSFTLRSRGGVKMKSGEYEKKEDAMKAIGMLAKTGSYAGNYSIVKKNNRFQIKLENILLSEDEYVSKQDAEAQIKKIAEEFSGECNDPEGLHLIEHILLRPREKQFARMQVCLDDCNCPCEMDPYSFRASVVLPYWPGHFDNMFFREYFETKIREEAPAHVMLKICWLNSETMRDFEVRCKNWIESLAAYTFDRATNRSGFEDANNKMIEILKDLHSEYPQASLHNCDESKEKSNVVILNKTVLGTFKN